MPGIRLPPRKGVDSTPVTFYINGQKYTVYDKYDVGTSLNDYIRDVAGLRGTKVMCREGGCGCCAVTVRQTDHTTGQDTSFSINSKSYAISPHSSKQPVYDKYDVGTSLNDYIRDVAGLRGTKVMCREGGCGCCAVTVRQTDHTTGQDTSFSINSCMTPLYSVDGWQITTVEGLGSRKDGYHPIQDRIANFNGSQCGYCTPGMVMNMYGLLHQNRKPTQQEVEDQFDGNICRCTGYRPILDGMKSFATDSTIPGSKCIDIEDLNKKICPRSSMVCKGENLRICAGDQTWYRPETLKDLTGLVMQNQGKKIRFLYGNTASGVYKGEGPFNVFIDLHNIKDLYQFQDSRFRKERKKCAIKKTESHSMEFGANMSITNLINSLDQKKSETGYGYFDVIAKHLRYIGNIFVRNGGSWAGNVMIKHAHPEFPSDVFTLMEAAGAHISIVDCADGSVKSYPLYSFITEVDMKNKLIVALELFEQEPSFRLKSYKIMPRSQNAHACVNAGFQISIDGKFKVISKPSIVLGGINKNFIHAAKTEAFLTGKTLTDEQVMKSALDALASELEPTSDPVLASPRYRQSLAVNLFYKCLLQICGAKQQTRASGPRPIERPLSTGVREFQDNKSDWPLKEPMPKLAAHAQATGGAEFINDIPSSAQELYGAFVIASQGPATLGQVNPDAALKLPGVVDYFSVKDIPEGGINNYMPSISFINFAPEELFCSGKILYAGQQIGLIIAESQVQADEAAEKVSISYIDPQSPILTIDQAIAKESYHANPMAEHKVGDPESAMKKSAKTVSGECRWGTNYHFYMENQVTLVVPSEERLDVYASTHSTEASQGTVSMVTGLPINNVTVTVPRVGGSFGGKLLTSFPVTGAAALAAYKLSRPVKVSVNMSTNMKMAGKRFPVLGKYEVGFDEKGRVNVVSIDVYCDGGASPNSMIAFEEITNVIDQGYFVPNWRIKLIACMTNKPPNTTMRAPGPFPACYMIESVMEHVAKVLNRNPVDVKEINLYQQGQIDLKGHVLTYCTIRKLWTELRKWAEVERRQNEIKSFNAANQWKKRALTMTPAKHGLRYIGPGFVVDVAIYARDGTVSVCQGGVEMGQGLFTKVAQAVAMSLGIPVSTVKVLPNHSHTTANSFFTGGSVSSELAVMSALKCCEILNERMAPIREKHPDYDWKNLLKACDNAGVELTAKTKVAPRRPDGPGEFCYFSYCAGRHAEVFTKYDTSLVSMMRDAIPFYDLHMEIQPKKPDGPGEFCYFSYCAGATEVELDVLTGENQVRRVDVLFDCGESLNPDIDIGQIEGALVMGIGSLLTEEIHYDTKTGAVLNDGTWGYMPPTTKDIPVDIRIKLLPDAPNPIGVRGSKASGEPPILMATGAFYALKQAMEEARAELTGNKEFHPPVAPLTVERLMLGCGVGSDKLVL